MVAGLGHLFIGGGGRDHRDAATLGDRSSLQRTSRGDLTDQGYHLVSCDQFTHKRGGLTGLGLVVLGDHPERLA